MLVLLTLLKTVSIPRLELMDALIGLRLEVPSSNVTYWVDSLNVGYWIRGQSREYKPFIAHRVAEIHEKFNPNQWRYVPTDMNPADLGTRGVTAQELTDSTKWWNGPDFLCSPEAEWPECKFDKPSREALCERKLTPRPIDESSTSYNTIQRLANKPEVEEEEWRLEPSRYSKWYKVKPKGQLEVGLLLVWVRSWLNDSSATAEGLKIREYLDS